MRSFLGIFLPEAISEQVSRLCFGLKNTKWVAQENFHITLHFLGEFSEDFLYDFSESLKTINYKPFQLSLQTVGTFIQPKLPSPVWAGVSNSIELDDLKKKIDKTLSKFQISPNNHFVPHVTLGRWKSYNTVEWSQYSDTFHTFETEKFTVNEFHLIQSVLSSKGSKYTILESFAASTD